MTDASRNILRWRRDPVAFVREQFRVEPDEWQKDALLAFASRDPALSRIALQACAGPGKSAVLAWLIWWFISCWGDKGEHPKGFAVAVTKDNLDANLWPELSKWQQRSAFLMAAFVWTSERVKSKDHPETWFVEARSFPKTASPDEMGKTLSGLHGKYVAAFIDESGGIPIQVARAADQALSTGPEFGKIVQSGNPLTQQGMLFAATQSSLWHVIRITGDPDDPKRSPRISIEWARAQIAEYGRDNAWVQAYILGKFPPGGINTLLSPDQVRDAMQRHAQPGAYEAAPKIIGVDVAREGDDRSVLFGRQGVIAFLPTVLRNVDSLQGAGRVAQRWSEWEADACFVDDTGGFGGGWIDQLRALGRNPIGIHFAGGASTKGFANKRAEMWWAMAEWVKGGGCLPNIPELIGELSAPTYSFKGDAILLEDKKLVKKRLQRSPDLADALALTFAHPVMSRQQQKQASTNALIHEIETGKRKRYDPFARF